MQPLLDQLRIELVFTAHRNDEAAQAKRIPKNCDI